METCNWSHAQRHKARAAFMRQENEFLRQDRVLNSKANTMKQAKGVSIAGYEVVKVLGKGSFGVVRLVKEKVQPQTDAPVVTDVESKKRTKTDMASLKLTAREALPLLGYRRKELTKLKKEVYAMKVIRKSEMLRNSQEGHLRAERDFLVASENSRWIVPLIAAFQDNRHLYLVMDYCVGGDFLGLLIRKNTLSEDATRWYIAEMILCVEEAHALRWIHRDVKPDNFLISASGHLKISDFGLAFDGNWSHDQAFFHDHRHSLLEKLGIEVQGDEQDKAEAEATQASQNIGKVMAGRLQPSNTEKSAKVVEEPAEDEPVVDWRDRNQRRKLARSVVGTSQYMAPEVIRGELYDGRCDWWSIGIILYECLFGFTPFACENRQETKLKILKHTTTLCFPDDQQGFPPISSDVLDLMKRLLREKEDRLSSPKYILNDYAHTQEDHNTYRIHGAAHRSSKNYQGKHVYPEDADDIKAHPWFRNTDWTSIHKKKPPFIPRVKGWEDTKYFDDDEPVSDIDSSSEDEEVEPTPIAEKENLIGPSKQDHDHAITGHHPEDQHIIPSTNTTYTKLLNNTSPLQPPLDGGAATNGKTPTTFKKPKREKKRPRDKILRDPKTAKIALDMRLKGAFLGYSYRRPKGVQSVLERVEAEVEIEIEGLNSLIDGCYNCGVEGGEGGCGRRDSAIAGIEMVGGGGGQREIVREGGRGIEPVGIPGLQAKGPGGNGNPSPRCSTPVENGMGMDGPNQRSGMM